MTSTTPTPGDERRYVPAAGRRAFTRLYDPVLALTTRERRFRALLRDQVMSDLPPGGSVVDVGCGTGTFAIALAAARPDAHATGVDGDPAILGLARRKPGAAAVTWRHGLADELPLEDASADAAVMSLLLHHLDPAGKRRALAEAVRVLRPGGRLHIADWGRPHDPLMRGAFLLLQTLDGFENTRDHAAGRLPAYLNDTGLQDVTTRARLRTAWGSLQLLHATPALTASARTTPVGRALGSPGRGCATSAVDGAWGAPAAVGASAGGRASATRRRRRSS